MKVNKVTYQERQSALSILPDIALIQCRDVVEKAIGEAGRIMLTAILQASAHQLTGPVCQGRAKSQGSVRHGTQPGSVFLGVSKVSIERPRIRSGSGKGAKEVKVPAYETLRTDEGACEKVHKAVLSGLSTRKFEQAVSSGIEAAGMSKSSVSRRFVKQSAKQLEEFASRPVPKGLVAIMLDGIHMGGYCFITAVGIDSNGAKHALGIAEGTTENAAVCGDLLKGLRDRGADFSRKLLLLAS